MLASPFLYIDLLTQDYTDAGPQQSALFGLVFMTGMIFSITGLYRLEAAGSKGNWLFTTQLAFISLAQAFHLDVLINGESLSSLQSFFEWFRPLSYLFMLVIGTAILIAGKIKGFASLAPMLTGTWAPLALWIFTISPQWSTHVAGLISFTAWFFTGWIIYQNKFSKPESASRQFA